MTVHTVHMYSYLDSGEAKCLAFQTHPHSVFTWLGIYNNWLWVNVKQKSHFLATMVTGFVSKNDRYKNCGHF